jgi:hypothetical protein
MYSNTHRPLLLVALVAVVMPATVTAGSKRTAGTLSMNARLVLVHSGVAESVELPS